MRTQIPHGHELAPKIVQKKLFLEQKKAAYFDRFFSPSGDLPVYEKTDFAKEKGDTMTFGLKVRLTGEPVTGNETMRGKEDKLTFYAFSITLDRQRYAVEDDGALSRQRFVGDLPTEARSALVTWGAERIDKCCMDALVDNPTTTIFGGTSVSAVGGLGAGDVLTPEMISRMKARALTQRGDGKTPLQPILINGKKHLVLLVSQDVAVDLKYNEVFVKAQTHAANRGDNNPLFTGALGVWDDVIIHEHENVPVRSDGGASKNIPYSHCTLMGASALCWAWGERPSIVEESHDYEEFQGFCWRMTSMVKKAKFNGHDFGAYAVIVADTRATGRATNYK